MQAFRSFPLRHSTSLLEYEISEQQKLVHEIQALLLEKLSVRVESADTELHQTGILDSMTLVQFILQMEEHFGFHLPMEDLEPDSFRSVAMIAELVARRTPNHTVTDDAREQLRIPV